MADFPGFLSTSDGTYEYFAVVRNKEDYEKYFAELKDDVALPKVDFAKNCLLYAQGGMTSSSSMGYKLISGNDGYKLHIRASYFSDGIYPMVVSPWKCVLLMKNVPVHAKFSLEVERIDGELPMGYTIIRND